MKNKVYIRETVIKTLLQNFLYSSNKVEKNFYQLLTDLGVKEDKYILKNYNNYSFDCVSPDNTYTIRLGREYANNMHHSTIEITHNDISVNYFYYLDEELNPALKVRDFSKEVNGKKITEVINYSPYTLEKDAYIRNLKQDNNEVFFYLDDPKIDHDEFDKKILSKQFHINWPSIYYLLESYGDLKKYLVYYKEDDKIIDLASYGFPIEDVFQYYENSNEEEKTKVRIKSRDEEYV